MGTAEAPSAWELSNPECLFKIGSIVGLSSDPMEGTPPEDIPNLTMSYTLKGQLEVIHSTPPREFSYVRGPLGRANHFTDFIISLQQRENLEKPF